MRSDLKIANNRGVFNHAKLEYIMSLKSKHKANLDSKNGRKKYEELINRKKRMFHLTPEL